MNFRIRLHALLALIISASSLLGQDEVAESLTEALAKTKVDLEKAIATLDKTRAAIAAEKPKFSGEFNEVEQQLREKRRLLRIARMGEEDRQREIRILQRDLATRSQDANYIAGLLKDHALKVQTLAKPGSPTLMGDDQALLIGGTDEAKVLENRLFVLDASITRLESLFGGCSVEGEAANQRGNVTQGTMAAFGPVSYFLSYNGNSGGEVIDFQYGEMPRYSSESPQAIATLLRGDPVDIAIDVSGGNARALAELRGGPMGLIKKGGIWIWPILLLALLSTIFGLLKLAQFARYREPSDAWVTAMLAALRTKENEKVYQIAGERRHPVGQVMVKLVKTSEESPDLVEETLYEQLMGVQAKVSTMLPVIAITAATAPLLGLLGTVSGMISTFNLITLFGSGDPKPLAGGISEALITTLFGLVVAIPALIIHAFLSRRAQGIVQTTERLGLCFINGLRSNTHAKP